MSDNKNNLDLSRTHSELRPLTDLSSHPSSSNGSGSNNQSTTLGLPIAGEVDGESSSRFHPYDEDLSWFNPKNLRSKAEYNHLAKMASVDVLDMGNSVKRFRNTNIVCTIGPKTNSVEAIVELRKAGMNVLRMNFSHGTYEYHASVIANLHKSYEVHPGPQIAVALDTKGPEIRTGLMKDNLDVELVSGSHVFVRTQDEYATLSDEQNIYVDYKNITNVLQVGGLIYVDDGLIKLEVLKINAEDIECLVLNHGALSSHKGVNLPGAPVDLPSVSEKDVRDLKWGVEQNVDIIFASFIRNGEALREIRTHLGEEGKRVKIISKIEDQQGLINFDEILLESDGIMVARGDLGIEIPAEKVFVAQKMIMAKCNMLGKPVIVATQMLESMTVNPRPTRAEVSDVANAVLDGADCVMLSGETAKGDFPYAAVETMSQICLEAERTMNNNSHYKQMVNIHRDVSFTSDTLAGSAVNAAFARNFQAIIVFSVSGNTARLVSKYRPSCPIICVTTDPVTARAAMLYRGVFPVLVNEVWDEAEPWLDYTERQLEKAVDSCKNRRIPLLVDGDTCVVLQGWAGGKGQANTMRLVTL